MLRVGIQKIFNIDSFKLLGINTNTHLAIISEVIIKINKILTMLKNSKLFKNKKFIFYFISKKVKSQTLLNEYDGQGQKNVNRKKN